MAVLPIDPDPSGLLRRRRGGPIAVGLVNNMPDAALKSTERQFRELLTEAAGTRTVTLRVFSFPGLGRSEAGCQHVRDHHEDVAALWNAELDGLIVTGTEPRARDLADEPYWPSLARLIDWAAEHTIATVWSCLAAHAAVYRLDGIARRSRGAKLSGVFECIKTANHPLVGYGPAHWCTPHSRYNELAEEELAARGYRILARSPAAGADIFVKRQKSLFLFLQGHPEYDAGALAREYRRDVGRFLAGERDRYPELPSGYFAGGVANALLAFRERALRERDAALLADFPTPGGGQSPFAPWRGAAIRLFSNWLSYLGQAKSGTQEWTEPHGKPHDETKARPLYG